MVAKSVFEAQAERLQEIEWNPEAWFRFGLKASPVGSGEQQCGATFQCALKTARDILARYIGGPVVVQPPEPS